MSNNKGRISIGSAILGSLIVISLALWAAIIAELYRTDKMPESVLAAAENIFQKSDGDPAVTDTSPEDGAGGIGALIDRLFKRGLNGTWSQPLTIGTAQYEFSGNKYTHSIVFSDGSGSAGEQGTFEVADDTITFTVTTGFVGDDTFPPQPADSTKTYAFSQSGNTITIGDGIGGTGATGTFARK